MTKEERWAIIPNIITLCFIRNERIECVCTETCFGEQPFFLKYLILVFLTIKAPPPPPNLEKYLLLSFWSMLLTQRELHTGFRSSPKLTDNLQTSAEGRGQSERRLCSEGEVTTGKMTQCTGPLCLRRKALQSLRSRCHVFSGVGGTGPKATKEKLLTGPASARTWEEHSPGTLGLLNVLDKILMKQTSL